MTISPAYPRNDVVVLAVHGRLDAFGAEALNKALREGRVEAATHVVLDMAGVSYLSSAALRVLLATYKTRKAAGGSVTLAAVPAYSQNVLEIAGFAETFPMTATVAEALAGLGIAADVDAANDSTGTSVGVAGREAAVVAETRSGEWGTMRYRRGSDEPGYIEIAGDINDVLASRVTPAHVFSKRFSNKAYSIGLGGLGETLDDYFTLMGEMITIGGTMVWLPCDGHGTPDYLVPKNDAGQVLMRTGFNASLSGPFNEYVEFVSARPEGATMTELYQLLFAHARERRPEFKGAIGLAMRAEMPAVFGAGVVKAPVEPNKPENGKFITDPSNFATWFEFDKEPRLRGVTGLVAGCGIDLTANLSAFDQEYFKKTFYYNPANTGATSVTLHNHVVAFGERGAPAEGATLEGEIAAVVEQGEFLDMRHMLDASTVSRAIIGVIYAQDFRPDPECVAGHA